MAEGGRLSTCTCHFYFLKPHEDDLKSNVLLNVPSFLLKASIAQKSFNILKAIYQRKEVLTHLGALTKWNPQLRNMEDQNKSIYSEKTAKDAGI